MTLILALCNHDNAILVSDRRLVSGGTTVTDEFNKAATLRTRDSRFLVAFTGLAEYGTFHTSKWLFESLLDAAPPEYLIDPMLHRLSEKATNRWSSISVHDPGDKRLSIVLVGYGYDETPPRAYLHLVSNYEDLKANEQSVPSAQFRVNSLRDTGASDSEPRLLAVFGAHQALLRSESGSLAALLQPGHPPEAIVGKCVEVVRHAADSPNARGMIGRQCSSIVMPSDPLQPASQQYHSDKAVSRAYGVSVVEARGGEFGCLIKMDPYFEVRDAAGLPLTIAVNKVGRNHPCPCGSGRKYKRCHGRGGDPKRKWRVEM